MLCGTAGLEKGVHLLDGLAGSADKTDAFVMVLSLPVKNPEWSVLQHETKGPRKEKDHDRKW